MLIAAIPVTNLLDTEKQISLVQHDVDGIELRLDYLSSLDFDAIAQLCQKFNLTMIFTLRKKSQGGYYQHPESQRLQDILNLSELSPDYIDLEYDTPLEFLNRINDRHPQIKLICSYHQFDETPADLFPILQRILHPSFDHYKIATHANTSLDSLRMLEFVFKCRKQYSVTGICMGEDGKITRILSPIIGNIMNYISLNESQSTAPGQLTLNEAMSVYHIRKLNLASKIYALLGDPVQLSPGHHLHNQAIELLDENAVYVKLRVRQHELAETIKLSSLLPFYGFSVTMPHKEAILPLLDGVELSSKGVNAINSICRDQEQYIGFNTDGIGAIQALEEVADMSLQKIIILGAGGAARAIAYEARKINAEVIIINRTLSKAMKIAREFGYSAYDFKMMNNLKAFNYTVLINTLPESIYSELSEILHFEDLLTNTIIMDIANNPTNKLFEQLAIHTNSLYVGGHKMYINQALLQIAQWYRPEQKQLNEIRDLMNQHFFKILN